MIKSPLELQKNTFFRIKSCPSVQLTVWKPNFEIEAQKFVYTDIWSLFVSPDGLNAFMAKDNECIVSDFCKTLTFNFFFANYSKENYSFNIQSNLSITNTLETQKLWPLLTVVVSSGLTVFNWFGFGIRTFLVPKEHNS